MPRRQLVMVAAVAAALVGAALLVWRGEGLAGAFLLVGLAAVILLQLDARKRLSDLAADVRRNRAELRTLAARTANQETELKDLTRQVSRATRRISQASDDVTAVHEEVTAVGDQVRGVEVKLSEETERARKHRQSLRAHLRMMSRDSLTQTQALLQLHDQFAPTAPLPAVAGWAMEPTALVELVNLIAQLRPQLVVECGSGTSTLWIAYALRRNGSGRVVALDHKAEFAAASNRVVAEHGLTEWAQVQHAPLTPTSTPRGDMPWYSADLTGLDGIELLLVDGPPQATGELARYPALPVLADRLAPGAHILFDDADRPGEVAALDAWQATYALETVHDLAGRALLLRLRTN